MCMSFCKGISHQAIVDCPVKSIGMSTLRKPASSTKMRPAQHSAGRVAYLGVFVALAVVLGYVEMLIPISMTVPGIKLGLSNIVVLIVLYTLGERSALLVVIVKVCVVSLLFGNMALIPFSMTGGLLSWALMVIASRLMHLPFMSVSMVGGVAHNVGQIIVVCIVYTVQLGISLLWVLMLAGIAAGLCIGLAATYALRAVRSSLPLRDMGVPLR